MNKDIFLPVKSLPFFSKQTLKISSGLKEEALNGRIMRAKKKGQLLFLKKGLYTTKDYYLSEPDKSSYLEFISSILRAPSYLSLEYVLGKYDFLTEATYPITCITIKSNRRYRNFLGQYNYYSLRSTLFFGFEKKYYQTGFYYQASLSKALFDYLYLKKNLSLDLEYEINEGLRLNWDNFSQKDLQALEEIIKLSESQKMKKILSVIKKLYA